MRLAVSLSRPTSSAKLMGRALIFAPESSKNVTGTFLVFPMMVASRWGVATFPTSGKVVYLRGTETMVDGSRERISLGGLRLIAPGKLFEMRNAAMSADPIKLTNFMAPMIESIAVWRGW